MTIHGLGVLGPEPWPTGCRMVRLWDCGVTWKHLHLGPGRFDFTPLDELLKAARAGGTTSLLYVLGATPQWAAADPTLPGFAPWLGPGSNSAPATMALWDEYVTTMVQRYAHRIRAWQVWNEPQLRWFWGYGTYEQLAEMTRRAYRIIKAHDAGLRVVSAPVLPRPGSGGMTRGRKYLEALAAKGWPIDVHAAHLYPEPGFGALRWSALARTWRRGLVDVNAPRRPRWVTETNYNLGAGRLPAPLQGSLVQATDLAATRQGIARVLWYTAGRHSNPDLLGIPFTPGSPGLAALTPLMEAP